MKKNDITENLNYQEGLRVGRRMVNYIERTNYKTLENAIKAKKEFGEELSKQLGYDESNADYAENLGLIAAFEEALEEQTNE